MSIFILWFIFGFMSLPMFSLIYWTMTRFGDEPRMSYRDGLIVSFFLILFGFSSFIVCSFYLIGLWLYKVLRYITRSEFWDREL